MAFERNVLTSFDMSECKDKVLLLGNSFLFQKEAITLNSESSVKKSFIITLKDFSSSHIIWTFNR